MILDKEVEIKIGSKNKKYYIEKGYDVKLGDSLIVPIEDLYEGSKVKVNVQCQNSLCTSKNKKIQYRHYIVNINANDNHKYYCSNCSNNYNKNKLAKLN